MKNIAPAHTGRHFLQIPGPTNVPDRVLQAMAFPTIDHRGPEFSTLGKEVVAGMKRVFQTAGTVVLYPSSGTGAWEAALVNTLSPGDRVLMFETGHFASLWRQMAGKLGIEIEFVPGDWRHGVDPAQVEEMLTADREHRVKAVCIVHNETSTGVASRVGEVRAAIDHAGHPALFIVDTISSLASIDYRHDEWKVDVTVGGSQKGLMLPPGLGFNAVSDKALAASKTAKLTRSYWDWQAMLETGQTGFFPYTPGTNLLYGLRESLKMLLDEEGLDNVFARHARHGEATRRAVAGWGLETLCLDAREHSNSLTAVLVPEGHDADRLREVILDGFDMSLGTGLGKMRGKIFRIGHLGHFNDLMLCGTLCGVEMGLARAGVPHKGAGVAAALDFSAAVRQLEDDMTPEQIERASSALAAARSGQAIAGLPADAIPRSEADSYQIQDAVIAKLGEKIGGWKVGMSPEGGHFAAPIYASRVASSPASLPARGFHLIGIECEIGFRINQALAPRPQPYTRAEVVAVATMHPTIEIVDLRYQDFRSLDRLQVLADNFSNGGLVYGPAATNWEGLDLAHVPIDVTCDGKHFAECTGLRAGDPLDLLVAAVNHACGRGGVASGTFVTTGTHTGMVFTDPGVGIAADYGRLGRVEVAFPR